MSEHPRNDGRYAEDLALGFAIYCDMNGLTFDEGRDFAERIADDLLYAAEERRENDAA